MVPELTIKWQDYFANIAEAVSKGSKDPSTRHGAVIYRPDLSIASTGFNGLPRGIPDTDDNLFDRERKLKRIVHAEANALDHKRECVRGYGLVVTGTPCPACALKIISNGITNVYYFPMNPKFEERWKEECKDTHILFKEANVGFHLIR